jgi:hypothetical protein
MRFAHNLAVWALSLSTKKKTEEDLVQHLPGWTVQCLNAGCSERGHWVRVYNSETTNCVRCGAPLQNVPPPLMSRLRMRTRPLAARRPLGRR